MSETWRLHRGETIWSLHKSNNQIKAQRGGFDLEEEVQRNERDLALAPGRDDMEFAHNQKPN